ncbi:hypothetical protein [Agreia bicolorata]|nr:hypothetical protein [Agreia bicolorata]
MRGAAQLILEEVLAPARIEQRVRELDDSPTDTAPDDTTTQPA